MSNPIKKRDLNDPKHGSNFVFSIITLLHDNPILPFLINPFRLLKTAGLKPGQKVLKVGCGPGFFTIPAAEILGDEGILYARKAIAEIDPADRSREAIEAYRIAACSMISRTKSKLYTLSCNL